MNHRTRREAIEDMNPLIPIKAVEFIHSKYPTDTSYEALQSFTNKVARRFGVLKETASKWITAETT